MLQAVLLCSSLLRIGFSQKFYIYDWPYPLRDVYPSPHISIGPDVEYDHLFYDHFGAGASIDESVGLYHTWQYALFKNVFGRMLLSKYRTRDPKEADVFIVPFDIGGHGYMDETTGRTRRGGHLAAVAGALLRDASADPVLWKNMGHDHILIDGITSFHLLGVKPMKFLGGICQNCTVLTIETTPGFVANERRLSRKWWYAVPYPSSFHWNEHMKSGAEPWRVRTEPDKISIFCIGSVKTLTADSTKIRRTLHQQCSEQSAACVWHQIAHSSNGVVNGTDLMSLYLKATYCLCPPGDSYTRKALFDSIISGCIPVIFYRASLAQYIWHIKEAQIDDIAVFIERTRITVHHENIVDILTTIPEITVSARRRAIEKIAPLLQYSVIPDRLLQSIVSRNSSLDLADSLETWDPPFEDANDVIIKALCDPKTIEPLQGFSEAEFSRRQSMKWPA